MGDIMFFWNRVEIYCGFSLKDFSDLRDSLVAAGLHYDYRYVNHNNSTRGRFGSLFQNPNLSVQYYLYVSHKDYDQAMFLTSNRNT